MIEISHVGYSYDGTHPALDDVCLQVVDGELLCILGENGSGKSTLAKMLNALLIPTEGNVSIDGLDTRTDAHWFTIRQKVAMVFQNPDDALVTSLVRDEVAFGPANLGLPAEELAARVRESLAVVGLAGYENRDVNTLSGGQKQRVALAGALAMHPRVLVLDEATAMLDPAGRTSLMQTTLRLHDQGITVVYITHFMEEATLAERVVVMREGHVIGDGTPDALLTDREFLQQARLEPPRTLQLAQALQTRGIPCPRTLDPKQLIVHLRHGVPHAPCVIPGSNAVSPQDINNLAQGSTPPMSYQNVTFKYDRQSPASALSDISFDLQPGEILGVAGATGSGKSTLLRLMGGLAHPTAGCVLLEGKDLAVKENQPSALGHVGLVFQYPEQQLFAQTVLDDVAFGPKNLGLSTTQAHENARDALLSVGLDPDAIGGMSPFALSGGQQRRVAIAGVLAMEPEIFALDEPSAGMDAAGHQALIELLLKLHASGTTIVLVSHDMNDVAALCDRVLLLDQGHIAALGTTAEVLAQPDLLAQLDLEPPFALDVARQLDIDGFFPSTDALADAIASR